MCGPLWGNYYKAQYNENLYDTLEMYWTMIYTFIDAATMNKRNPKATEVNVKKLSKFAHINVPEFKQEIQKVTLTKEKEIPKPKFAFDLEGW